MQLGRWYRTVFTCAKADDFCVIAPSSFVGDDRYLRGAYCHHDDECTAETSVTFYENLRCSVTEELSSSYALQ
jgi:hypothetical protein